MAHGPLVGVETEAVARMVDELHERAGAVAVNDAVERAANRAKAMISGIPRGATGDLASGLQVRTARSAQETRSIRIPIVNTVRYARYVFEGTVHMDARPPNVPAGQIGAILEREIESAVFG